MQKLCYNTCLLNKGMIEEMNEEASGDRSSAIAQLRATMAEIKAGNLAKGLCFEWHDNALDIDIDLDAANETKIDEACRMAILLLSAAENGTLLAKDEAKVSITSNRSGTSFATFGNNGLPIAAGENWRDLVEVY